nr:synaptobrevin, longin-like domain protein [Tanacetum cinerariifolium]
MAALKYKEEHTKIGYLLKPTGSDDYHQIIDFLSGSHIRYALTTNPTIFDSLVKQFWSSTTLRESELGPLAIMAIIDKTPYTITEVLARSHLQLADDGGFVYLPISKIYFGMDNIGYVTKGKLTIFKNKFSPQWRFLVYTMLHCLSTKSGSWDQFETRVTRQYKVLAFSSKLFANMRLNFAGNPMPLLPIMLLQAQAGEGAEVAAQDVPHPVPAPDQSPAHLHTPSRPQSPDPVAPVLEHSHSSSQPETAAGSFLSREDPSLGGDFHPFPLQSSHAPPAGHPSGALKDVVGKLVKKVKYLEVKLKMKKRKLVVSDSDPEDSTTQDMDLDALRALANAAVAADSDILSGNTLQVPAASPCAPTFVPTGASGVASGTSKVPTAPYAIPPGATNVSPGPSVNPTAASVVPADSPKVLAAVPSDSPNVPAGVSSKGKSLMVEEDIPVTARSFRQREEDRLGEEAAKRLHEEEMAELERERAEAQRKRQQEIRKVQSQSQIQSFGRTLKRPGPVSEEPFTKKPKSPKAPTPSMSEVPISPAVTSPPAYRTRRKSLSQKHMHKPKSTLPSLDLDATAKTFLKVVVDEDSDDEDYVDEVWSAVVGWEVLSTPLGDINALYRIDVELMKKMLLHKLDIDLDFVGNDMTTAEQLIQFIKNQIVAAQASSV